MKFNSKRTPIRNVARVMLPKTYDKDGKETGGNKTAIFGYDEDNKFLIGVGVETDSPGPWLRNGVNVRDCRRVERAYLEQAAAQEKEIADESVGQSSVC